MNNINTWVSDAKTQLTLKNLPENYVGIILEDVYGPNYQHLLIINELQYQRKLNALLTEVLKKELPLAQIIGYQYFYGRKFVINDNVLIPRVETENLIYKALSIIRSKFSNKSNIKILDLCTGSGCIATTTYLELQDEFNIDLYVSDISSKALKVAKENLDNYQINATFVNSDLVDEFIINQDKFDVILSNPPYIPSVEEVEKLVYENEPHLALFGGKDGLDLYKRLKEDIYKIVNDEYIIAFEMADGQGKALKDLFSKKNNVVEVKYDMFDRERNVVIWSNNDSK